MNEIKVMRKNILIQQAASLLAEAGIDDAQYEARFLLEWATRKDRLSILHIQTIDEQSVERYQQAVERRRYREPLAFIVGEVGFWTLDLFVSPETLIPRADSETLIDALLAYQSNRHDRLSILDLGTGTGCLLLAALSEYPYATGVGVDISEKVIELASHNAQRNGLAHRAQFQVGSWDEGITERFDVVLSNPPYIEHATIAQLMPEVKIYEPYRALDGGEDGLEAYRILCQALPRLLTLKGCAIFELGIGQEEAVVQLAEKNGLRKLTCRSDLAGIARALVLVRA